MRLLKEVKDILRPFGELDLLYYYSIVAEKLRDFLWEKEIAAKIAIPGMIGKLLKRGSQLPPLFVPDLRAVREQFLKLRVGHHLKEVREKLTRKEILLWGYFFPRKMIEFLYACNKEHPGLEIERIFIDIDKGKEVESDVAREVAAALLEEILHDERFKKLVKFRPVILWTGNSFHLYLLLQKAVAPNFYEKFLSYRDHEKNVQNFTYRWALEIQKKTGIKVEAGHEKSEEHLILDTSGTPSGKLARAPFSLHVKNYKEYDGVAVPLSAEDLKRKGLVRELRKLTPEAVVKNLAFYARLL